MSAPLLSIRRLSHEFRARSGARVQAVSDVSFDIDTGETLGLVGESGCGKTTIGRAIVQLPPPSEGEVLLDGIELTDLSASALRAQRASVQIVFQDPVSSLNPRRTIAASVAAPLDIAGRGDRRERDARVREMLDAVGLDPNAVWNRYPHELSGGQCQRVSIARALILRPRLLVCDEPVSSLDVSVQAQILNLLEDAKARFGLTMLFIAHDLAVVRSISDRIAVMYLGRLCEIGPSATLTVAPKHPYTQALLAAMPDMHAALKPVREAIVVRGETPSPLAPPSGCRFRTRCSLATALCAEQIPMLREIAPNHQVACHHA